MEQPGLVQYLRLLKIHHLIFFRRYLKIVDLEHENSCQVLTAFHVVDIMF